MIAVARFDDVAAIAADAGRDLDRAAQPSLYRRLDWLRLHEDHSVAPLRPYILRARDDDGSAWLFLAEAGRGAGIALANWYTLDFAPAYAGVTAGRAPLLGAIARNLRGRFGRITLAPLSAATCGDVAECFRAAGWRTAAAESGANWVTHVAGDDFATYWARRPSRLRNTARRKGQGIEVTILDRFDDAAWAAYEAVYAASWKPAEGSPAFLRGMAEQEGRAGCLRLGVARLAGRPVAAQLWTVEHGVATIHKLAYVEAERVRSPGTVLGAAMFAHVIDRDRPRLIDFGTGDDAYKADWMDERRPLYRLDLYDPRSPAGIIGLARAALARVRGAG